MAQSDPGVVHISSAVVRARPEAEGEVIAAIGRLAGVEVFASESGRIAVIIEGDSSGAVSARLTEITLIDGVVSANLVYEQVETLASLGEPK